MKKISVLPILLIVLLSLVLLTTIYQQNYRNLTESYESTSEQLSEISQNFSLKLKELNRTTTELKLKAGDKAKLDELYSDIANQKEKLEAELSTTRQLLQETTDQLLKSQAELADAEYDIIKKGEEILEFSGPLIDFKQAKLMGDREFASLPNVEFIK